MAVCDAVFYSSIRSATKHWSQWSISSISTITVSGDKTVPGNGERTMTVNGIQNLTFPDAHTQSVAETLFRTFDGKRPHACVAMYQRDV